MNIIPILEWYEESGFSSICKKNIYLNKMVSGKKLGEERKD